MSTAEAGAHPVDSHPPTRRRLSSLAILPTSSTQPALSDVRLSHILNGETCPPLAFPDFAAFITHKELSAENLLFVVWFKSYLARWNSQVADDIKVRIPIPSTRLGDRYQPFRYIDDARQQARQQQQQNDWASSSNASEPGSSVMFSDPFKIAIDVAEHHSGQQPVEQPMSDSHASESADASHSTSASTAATSVADASGLKPCSGRTQEATEGIKPVLNHTSLHPPLPPAGAQFLPAKDQPMREEVLRVFATFLRKGGSRELSIADELREFARVCLERSCAPESFLPIYEDIYATLEKQSVPHFISYAATNINRPKQLFWYIVGVVDFLIGAAIYLILTFTLSRHHIGYRAIRLPSAIFSAFGAMQFYSAMRGFCNQVWGRRHRQLRPWELDEPDDEANFGIESDTSMLVSANEAARSPRTESLRSLVFTPVIDKDVDAALASSEMHPLSDLGGSISSPTPVAPWEDPSMFHSPPSEHVADMMEKSRSTSWSRVRRSTIQVPSAGVVFPIEESHPPALEDDEAHILDSSVNSKSAIPLRVRPSTSQPDFSALFVRFGRGSSQPPIEDESKLDPLAVLDPATTVAPLTAAHSAEQANPPATPLRAPKIKVFGPETVIEDPSVLAYFESVVRDILVVGTTTGVIFIIISLAVPTDGA